MFLVVEFKDDSGLTVGIIPESWYLASDQKCYWPPVTYPISFIKSCKKPQANWSLCGARLLHRFSK